MASDHKFRPRLLRPGFRAVALTDTEKSQLRERVTRHASLDYDALAEKAEKLKVAVVACSHCSQIINESDFTAHVIRSHIEMLRDPSDPAEMGQTRESGIEVTQSKVYLRNPQVVNESGASFMFGFETGSQASISLGETCWIPKSQIIFLDSVNFGPHGVVDTLLSYTVCIGRWIYDRKVEQNLKRLRDVAAPTDPPPQRPNTRSYRGSRPTLASGMTEEELEAMVDSVLTIRFSREDSDE